MIADKEDAANFFKKRPNSKAVCEDWLAVTKTLIALQLRDFIYNI